MFTAPSQPEVASNKNGNGEGGDEEERFEILENNVDNSTVGDLAPHATPPTSASSNQKSTEQPQEEGASS